MRWESVHEWGLWSGFKDTDKPCFSGTNQCRQSKNKIKVSITLRTAEMRNCFVNYKCTHFSSLRYTTFLVCHTFKSLKLIIWRWLLCNWGSEPCVCIVNCIKSKCIFLSICTPCRWAIVYIRRWECSVSADCSVQRYLETYLMTFTSKVIF